MKVSDADRKLLKTLIGGDAEFDERVDKGLAFTTEVRLCAEHRQAGIREGIEMAAKVAESRVSTDTDWDNSYWNQCAENIATAIRALAGEDQP